MLIVMGRLLEVVDALTLQGWKTSDYKTWRRRGVVVSVGILWDLVERFGVNVVIGTVNDCHTQADMDIIADQLRLGRERIPK